MAQPERNSAPDIELSEQTILNRSFDKTFQTLVTQILSTPMAVKITTSGSVTYIGKAPTGSSQASAVWQAMKIDETTGLVITWADNGKYTQVATDLTSLTYT